MVSSACSGSARVPPSSSGMYWNEEQQDPAPGKGGVAQHRARQGRRASGSPQLAVEYTSSTRKYAANGTT